MDPFKKVARYRLSVLQLAEVLGNVTQAWKQRGLTRTSFMKISVVKFNPGES